VAGGIGALKKFHRKENNTLFIDTEDEVKILKDEIFNIITTEFCLKEGIVDASQIKKDPERVEMLTKVLLDQDAFTYREIGELIEVSKNYIYKVNIKK
ncbi:MAG: hypothetical protein GX947_07135, partial [Tissierellia bacterium]|nr:hypothetical protein [Tissierellia bacterium]